jgi:hypothetical protein
MGNGTLKHRQAEDAIEILGIIGGLLAIIVGLLIVYALQPIGLVMLALAPAAVLILLGTLAIYGSIIYTKEPMLAAKLFRSLGIIGGLIGGLLAIVIGLLIWFYLSFQYEKMVEPAMASAVVFILLGTLAIYGSIIYTKKPMLAAKLLLSCGGLGFLVLYELDYFFSTPYKSDYSLSPGLTLWLFWALPGIPIIAVGLIRWIAADKSTFFPSMPSSGILVSIITILLLIFGFNYLYANYEEIFGPESETFCKFYAVEKTFVGSSNNSTAYDIHIQFRVEAKKNMRSFAIKLINHSYNIKIIGFNENLPATRNMMAGDVIDPYANIQVSGDSGWVQLRISFIDIDAHEKYIIKSFELESIQTISRESSPGFGFVQGIKGMSLALFLVFLFRKMRNSLE